MIKSLCIFIFLFFVGVNFSNGEEKILISDKALFKVKNKVYFKSDMKRFLIKLALFKCIKPNSILLKSIGINKLSRTKKLSKQLLFKIILLKKLEFTIKKQEISVSYKKDELYFKCIKNLPNKLKRNTGLKNFLDMETYLSDRFSYKIGTKSVSKSKTKVEESINLFLKSLDKEMGHYVYSDI